MGKKEREQTAAEHQERPKSKLREYTETIAVTLLAAFLLKTFVVEAFRIPTGSMEDTLLEGDFLLVNKFIYGAKSPKYIPFTDVRIPYFQLPGFKKPERGDIIVLEFPGERDEVKPRENVNYIKRCVGLSGDTVDIVNKVVYVNGKIFPNSPNAKYESFIVAPGRRANPRIFPKGSGFNEDNYGPLAVPKKGDLIHLSMENLQQWETFIAREGHTVRTSRGEISIDGTPTTTYMVQRNYFFLMGDNRDNSLDSRFWGFMPEENIVGEALIIYWSWDQDISFANIFEKLGSVRWRRIGTIIR